VIVAARDEAGRLAATIAALRRGLPGAAIWVADDGSRDATASIARAMGAALSSLGARAGKGRAMEAAILSALAADAPRRGAEHDRLVVLCDGDLAESAERLAGLAAVAGERRGQLVLAAFARPRGGGLGILRAVARRSVTRATGARVGAPLSGQRALRAGELRALLPLASGYGMDVGMTIDALRTGMAVREVTLDLHHRALGRTPRGFVHRGRQLLDVLAAVRSRRENRCHAGDA
jgi:glycosyltransferase involved in cell wall biosynthesis